MNGRTEEKVEWVDSLWNHIAVERIVDFCG